MVGELLGHGRKVIDNYGHEYNRELHVQMCTFGIPIIYMSISVMKYFHIDLYPDLQNFENEISFKGVIVVITEKVMFSLTKYQIKINNKSKLQVLSFTFTPNCRRCPLAQKLTSFVLNVLKSCTLCPLGQTQLKFLVKSGHVQGT
ncbi:hypothetical protein Hanom_Chr08g00742981 [Helianthus anomalus]